MGWFGKQVEDAIRNILTDIKEALLGFANDIFEALLNPIVGVPAPESNSRYIVVGTPENAPWQSLYADFYLQYILPLTIMLLIVGFAYIGLRSGSISPYRRKRLLRRIGLVFMGSFVWFPLVSIPLQFVDAIGLTLAPINDMSAGFGSLIESGVGGLFVVLAMALVSNFLLIVAALVYGLRWLGILVLTPLMPLLGVFWALDVWPLSPASEIARRAAGIYPGLVLAGLPAAVLFRIGWQMNLTASADGLFSLFLGLVLIPAACLASIMTVYWSAPAVQTIARQGSAQNESGGCRLGSEIRHGKICSWCPERASGIRPEQSWPGDEKRTVPTWEWRLERIHTWVLCPVRERPRRSLQQPAAVSPKQAECATRRKKMLVGRHRRRKLGRNRRSRTQKRRSHGGDYS